MPSQMRELHPSHVWEVGDCMNMSGEGTFDLVLDKGMLDTLACVEGTQQPKLEKIHSYMSQVASRLVSGGHLVVLSFGQPETRVAPLAGHPSMLLSRVTALDLSDCSVRSFLYILEKTGLSHQVPVRSTAP